VAKRGLGCIPDQCGKAGCSGCPTGRGRTIVSGDYFGQSPDPRWQEQPGSRGIRRGVPKWIMRVVRGRMRLKY
jgi:hypothetical protein